MWLAQLLVESWNILAESAAFILVGFAIAAVLHVLMARGTWTQWLRGLGARSVLLASAIGLPLPLCSCSVLPAAVSLRKNGASKGAVLSFLISTPETSVQSVALTYALLGPVMAIFRPIASCITAVIAGFTENFIEKRHPSQHVAPDEEGHCCHSEEHQHEHESEHETHQPTGITSGLRHAFVDVFDDVVGWMLLGVVVAALIQVVVPDVVIRAVFGPPLQAMLIMLVIGIPLYVCAEASTPIAAALIVQGVSPGAALVFLLAGPATNIGAVGLLNRQLGKRTVAIYLVTIAVVSVTLGLVLDWFFGMRGVNLSQRALAEPLLPAWVKAAGAVIFLLLCVASLIRLNVYGRFAAALDRAFPVRVTPRRLTVFLVVSAIVLYAASGLVVIEPGQMGMIKTWGRVTVADAKPGLHYAWPAPFGSVDRIEAGEVHRIELGTIRAPSLGTIANDDRTWVLLGDENLANIQCAVHWRMRPGRTRSFAYGAADRDRLVENAVRAGLREVLGSAHIDTVLTTDQVARADAIQAAAQHVLDRCDCGIEIAAFHFLDLHAPAEVHEAFRDIASAIEDKVTRENQALARQAEIKPLAEGTRDKLIRAAQADKVRLTAEATGEAEAFLDGLAAYREYPALTRERLLFEMYDRILPGRRKYIRPEQDNLQLDLRFGGERRPASDASR